MKLAVLASPGMSTNILLNWLEDNGFAKVDVLLEEPVSRFTIFRYRARRLGLGPALGQVSFMLLALPLLRKMAKQRLSEILRLHNLRDTSNHRFPVTRFLTVNDPTVSRKLRELNPDAVLVNGTRIIKENTLRAVSVPFINIHAGITPWYRGVHGGYWARWNNDSENFGATIHLVDTGVDSGPVLTHIRIAPDKRDNFASYPLLQQAAALQALSKILVSLKQERPATVEPITSGAGQQWFHPTLGQYIMGVLRGVK